MNALFVNDFPAYTVQAAAWRTGYAEIVQAVRTESPDEFLDPAFQERLWNQNPIASVGLGISVTVKGAYTDRNLAKALLGLRGTGLTGTSIERGLQLQQACERILQLVRPHNDRRPVARTVRLMATLYPYDMCSILDARRIWEVSQLLGLPAYKHGHVAQHPVLRNALREVLPSELVSTDVDQSIMLWFLWERFCRASVWVAASSSRAGRASRSGFRMSASRLPPNNRTLNIAQNAVL